MPGRFMKEATTMVVVGTDAHKYSHTFVATDEVGRQLGEKTVKATTAGHATAIMWARTSRAIARSSRYRHSVLLNAWTRHIVF